MKKIKDEHAERAKLQKLWASGKATKTRQGKCLGLRGLMTIPRNSRRAKDAIAKAHDIKVYSLANCFRGEPLTDSPVVWGGPVVNGRFTELVPLSQIDFLLREMASYHAKLSLDGERYCIHIHDNLWYEFRA